MAKVLRLRPAPVGLFPAERPKVDDDLAAVLERCRTGEEGATRTLLLALGPPMLKVIRRVLGSKHTEIEDVLQEATIAVLRALPGFRGECTAKHFGCRIAALTALTTRRRDFARAETQAAAPVDVTEWAEGPEHEDWVLSARRREVLRNLLDELPEPQAEALILHCIVGLTVDELARTTHARLETARSRLRLAKAALRARIVADPAASELLRVEDA